MGVLREALHLKVYYGTRPRCCHLCNASREDSSFADFAQDAPVRATQLNAAAWLVSSNHAGTSPLLQLPAFNI